MKKPAFCFRDVPDASPEGARRIPGGVRDLTKTSN